MAKRAQTQLKHGEYTLLGYRAAEIERQEGRPSPSGGSADYHARFDRLQLVRQSQAFDRDNGLYRGIINRAVDNILGDGFVLQASTSNPKVNEKIEAKWDEFWQDPEIRGLLSGNQCERQVVRSLWVDGDIGTVKTDTGKIQLIEAERICYNKMFDAGDRIEQGVKLDAVGRPVAFFVADYSRYGLVQPSSAKPIGVDNFIFMAALDRPSQTRGVPVMTANFPMLHRVNDICDSEAVAWQLLSRLSIAVMKKGGPEIANQLSTDDPQASTVDQVKDLADRIQDFSYGMIFQGEPGEDIKGIERNIPGPNFTASVTMFLRLLGLPVGFPLELILLDWSKTNYSSARAALEQAFRMFVCWQRILKAKWYSPIYLWKLRQWIDEGSIPNRADILSHEWIAPSFPWIDQLKECESWGMRIDRGLSTHAEACKSVNRDRADLVETRQREVEDSILRARTLNEKYPEAKVDWRIFAGLAASATSSMGAPEKPAQTEDTQNTDAVQPDNAESGDATSVSAKE